jgi:hypothetical protein
MILCSSKHPLQQFLPVRLPFWPVGVLPSIRKSFAQVLSSSLLIMKFSFLSLTGFCCILQARQLCVSFQAYDSLHFFKSIHWYLKNSRFQQNCSNFGYGTVLQFFIFSQKWIQCEFQPIGSYAWLFRFTPKYWLKYPQFLDMFVQRTNHYLCVA